ncbi:terpenoid synthase [Mycena belliarum]|uniref:Terpene synthase n=1 Tax=Mycena belliarum TaxID=1033014 RepID=A0AAD6TWV1_9AGAR|nr:terpenoid synthase [Mycena belliae]
MAYSHSVGPATTSSSSATSSEASPKFFILPDLFSDCPFPLIYHRDGDVVAQESVDWLDSGCSELSPKGRKALHGLKAGELTAYCYYTAPPERLRIISDFMNYLFHLDNISDGMMTRDTEVLSDAVMNALWYSDSYKPTSAMNKEQPAQELNAAKLARDFWARCIQGAGPGTQARFKETMQLFFEAVKTQTWQRDTEVILNLEEYIELRRDTSGCKPCWALIEYAMDIDLPDFVADNPVIMALNQSANDLVTWSNVPQDIFSYNVEQSRGDTHNMIIILMTVDGHSLQSAMDYVGGLCRMTIQKFQEDRACVPSWGPEVDAMVERYVLGLEAWIVGSLHWSFMTERYFGKAAAEVKRHRFVSLISS